MDLKTYLKQMGDSEAARLFGVKPRTILSWRRGERRPRPSQAARIVEVTQGEVSYEGIYAALPARKQLS
jgi:DNA-binding transcriptional regulator YdaS (Cro superfamily)